jgi:IS5 family transposase
MRRSVHDQLHLVPSTIAHVHALELARIGAVLDTLPKAAVLVRGDLVNGGKKRVDPNKGREGMTAEQVLRAFLVKQMNEFSYDELAFHLADSSSYRSFCRLGIDERAPKKSTLQRNIKRVSAATWEAINRMVVGYAFEQGVETGKKVRTDCTVVESNIHEPTDSALLWDGVRVLVRLMGHAKEEFALEFNNHSRRAKRRWMGILNSKTEAQRLPLYCDLLKVTEKTVRHAERVAVQLEGLVPADMRQVLRASGLAKQLSDYVELTKRVIFQTQRRVLNGESVPASEKLVSIFEPHTDIIIKDRRDVLYGHKICLTAGASGIVTDVVIENGNPSDSTLAINMIKRQRDLYGRAPRQVSFDGGFTSKANLDAIKALGVEDVCFSKGRGLSILEMAKSTRVYRFLRNFRAGVEGTISFLKRVFGLDCCAWSGLASFKAYVCGAVLACNLLVVARHLLGS